MVNPLIYEAFRLVGGGIKGLLMSPSSRESFFWLVPLAVAGVWHHRSVNKKISVGDGLNYVFPKATYFSYSLIIDFLCIAATFFFFRVVTKLIMHFEFEEETYYELTSKFVLRLIGAAPSGLLTSSRWVDVMFTLGLFMSFEFGWWVGHWATHKVPLLWAFHKVHHGTTLMKPVASKRNHIIDDLLLIPLVGVTGGIVLAFFRAFGYAPSQLFFYRGIPLFTGAFLVFGAVRHSHVPITFGKLDWIFSSPFMHQVHHSYKHEHIDKNYGYNLTLFDWLFGTLYMPKPGEELKFGISEEHAAREPNQGFIEMYFIEPWADCRDFIRTKQIFRFRK